MTEKPGSIVEDIRKALQEEQEKSGGSMPSEVAFIPQGATVVFRFLSELDTAGTVKIQMHDRFTKDRGREKGMMPQPCFNYYPELGKCPFHRPGYRARTHYVWTVWNYEREAKMLLHFPATPNSPLNDLVEIYLQNGTIKDRDIKIVRSAGSQTTYRAYAQAPSEYMGVKKVPYGAERVYEIMKQLIRVKQAEGRPVMSADEEEIGGLEEEE